MSLRTRDPAIAGAPPSPGSIEGLFSGKAGSSVLLSIRRGTGDDDGVPTFHEVRLWRVPVATYTRFERAEGTRGRNVPSLWAAGDTPRNNSADMYSY